VFSGARRALAEVRRLGLRLVLGLLAVQAALVGVLVAMAQLRKRREGPREGFPWADRPEVELESGGRLKLYPFGVRLYEAMLAEIEGARETVFVGTFIWKGDEVGRRFVEALARKAREGVRVCVIFDGLANVVVPPSFKKFPEEIQTLHFRPLWGPEKLANPRNVFRYHRHLMSVDGRVAFLGGYNIGSLYAAGWRDTHVRISGKEAREVENDFSDFWNAHRTPDLPEISSARRRTWNPALVVRRNDPYLRIFPIRAHLIPTRLRKELSAPLAEALVSVAQHEPPHLKPHGAEQRLEAPSLLVGASFAEQDGVDILLDFLVYPPSTTATA